MKEQKPPKGKQSKPNLNKNTNAPKPNSKPTVPKESGSKETGKAITPSVAEMANTPSASIREMIDTQFPTPTTKNQQKESPKNTTINNTEKGDKPISEQSTTYPVVNDSFVTAQEMLDAQFPTPSDPTLYVKDHIAFIEENNQAQQQDLKSMLPSNDPETAIQSITKLPPLQQFSKMQEANSLAMQSQQSQLQSVQNGMEEITIPTGIASQEEVTEPIVAKTTQSIVPKLDIPSIAKKITPPTATEGIDHITREEPIQEVSTAKGTFVASVAQSRNNLTHVQDAAKSDLGIEPEVSLPETANPNQIQSNAHQAEQSINTELIGVQELTTQDYGESGMFPDKAEQKASIQIQSELQEQRQSLMSGEEQIPNFDAIEEASIQTELQERYQNDIDNAVTEMQEAGTVKDLDITEEKNKHHQDITTATEQAKANQRIERTKGQQQVAKQKQDWQSENKKIKDDATAQLEQEQANNEVEIAQKQAEGNKEIANAYAKADKDIEVKTKEADQKVAQQQQEGKEKEKKGWLESATDWVSNQFDNIKKAVNTIFDSLRAAVKSIVNWAKEKASSIINAVRDFAVKAIQAFGALAKTLVSAALFLFPETAKKFNALIDKTVAFTTSVIHKIAEGLEKTVHFLLDTVGRVIDGILAIYQKAINLALDVLEMVAIGALLLIQKIGWLGSAAKQTPEHFLPQMASELVGQDVEEPLANEIPKVFGLTMDEVKKNDAIAQADTINTSLIENTEIDESVLQKESYIASDFEVPVQDDIQFDDAVLAEIAAMPEGVPVEIGAVADPLGIESPTVEVANSATALQEDTLEPTPLITTDYINSLTQKEKEANGWVGPYKTVSERAQGAAGAMVDAVKKWWGENKIVIITAIVLGIAGLIAANILTGGAILAALPLLFNILSVFFAIDAVLQLGKHFKDYLLKAWGNDIAGGAKSMARGLAILAIELVFALLFGAKGVFKAAKAGIKTAKGGVKSTQKAIIKGAKSYAKGQVKNAKRLAAVTRNGSRRAVKNGKIVMQGVKSGSLKGAKNLKEVGETIIKRLGFDRYRVTRSGTFFKLEGHINPWVLLASGEVKHVDAKDVKNKRVGQKVTIDGEEAILIGKKDIPIENGVKGIDGKDVTGSGFVRKTTLNKDEAARLFEEMISKGTGAAADKLRKAMMNISEGTQELRKGIKGLLPKHFQAHHIIPRELLKDFKDFFEKIKFNIEDGLRNGIMLPPNEKVLKEFLEEMAKKGKSIDAQEFINRAFHQGSHPRYTEKVKLRVQKILDDFNRIDTPTTDDFKFYNNRLNKIIDRFREGLENGTEILN